MYLTIPVLWDMQDLPNFCYHMLLLLSSTYIVLTMCRHCSSTLEMLVHLILTVHEINTTITSIFANEEPEAQVDEIACSEFDRKRSWVQPKAPWLQKPCSESAVSSWVHHSARIYTSLHATAIPLGFISKSGPASENAENVLHSTYYRAFLQRDHTNFIIYSPTVSCWVSSSNLLVLQLYLFCIYYFREKEEWG